MPKSDAQYLAESQMQRTDEMTAPSSQQGAMPPAALNVRRAEWATVLGVGCGALVLVWPALHNGYPLVFSDTGPLLEMGMEPTIGWDKPWIYGPFLAVFAWGTTLWLPLAAQAMLVSWVLWLTQAVLGRPRVRLHIALCAVLAVGSAAPWFTSLLMPDVFTPVAVLCLFILAFGQDRLSRIERAGVTVLGSVAIAAHLAHLILAAGCIAALASVRWSPGWRSLWHLNWRPAVPLAAALAMLLATNAVGNGILGISPYGSVFALARLVGDGPGRAYLDRACPDPRLRLCAWQGRLSADSDEFLWHPQGPLWADSFGPTRFAPEAARLVPAIIAAYPLDTLRAAAANTLRQLLRVQVGDALVPDHLDIAVLPRLRPYLPTAEIARYQAALQPRGLLRDAAAPFLFVHAALLAAGVLGSVAVMLRCWRSRRALAGLAALALAAQLTNAFATGALSGPHDRYQARLAWLVLLAPLAYAARLDTSAGVIRTRPSYSRSNASVTGPGV